MSFLYFFILDLMTYVLMFKEYLYKFVLKKKLFPNLNSGNVRWRWSQIGRDCGCCNCPKLKTKKALYSQGNLGRSTPPIISAQIEFLGVNATLKNWGTKYPFNCFTYTIKAVPFTMKRMGKISSQ